MPIDVNLLRAGRGGDPEAVRRSQKHRFASVEVVDRAIELDQEWRQVLGQLEELKRERGALSKEIGKIKKVKGNAEVQVALMLEKKTTECDLASKEALAAQEVREAVAKIGNILEPSVPISQNEADNAVYKIWGDGIKRTDHCAHHHDLLHRIGGYEPQRGSAIAGRRAYFLTGPGVELKLALEAYSTQFLVARGFTLVQPPYFMNKDVMAGVAQLEDFDEALYKVVTSTNNNGDGNGEGNNEKYLIATSEQPLCAYHKGDSLSPAELPKLYAGVSTCFRKEAASHGKDTWGIFRVHQFEKVEQFCVCAPEESAGLLETLLSNAEAFYQSLQVPYRVVNVVSGELNNAATKKLDLEGWLPSFGEYRELVSCSNCTDFQSRAMRIRYATKEKGKQDKRGQYCHLLNATLCAVTRTICAVLENHQTADGVQVPQVLRAYMGGKDFLPFVRESSIDKSKMEKERAQSLKARTSVSKASLVQTEKKAGQKESHSNTRPAIETREVEPVATAWRSSAVGSSSSLSLHSAPWPERS
jgi:seryl-tRNA synthetase